MLEVRDFPKEKINYCKNLIQRLSFSEEEDRVTPSISLSSYALEERSTGDEAF